MTRSTGACNPHRGACSLPRLEVRQVQRVGVFAVWAAITRRPGPQVGGRSARGHDGDDRPFRSTTAAHMAQFRQS